MEEEKDSSKAMHNLVLRSQSHEKVSIGWTEGGLSYGRRVKVGGAISHKLSID